MIQVCGLAALCYSSLSVPGSALLQGHMAKQDLACVPKLMNMVTIAGSLLSGLGSE